MSQSPHEDSLEQNVERLLAVAPERARLGSDARARIRAELAGTWAAPTPQVSAPEAPARRLRLLPVLAAAAAVLLIAIGAWRTWNPDGQGSVGGGEDLVANGPSPNDAAVSPQVPDGPMDTGAQGLNGGSRASAGEPALVDANGVGRESVATHQGDVEGAPADSSPGPSTAGTGFPQPQGTAPDLRCTIHWTPPADSEGVASTGGSPLAAPSQVTLWVKAIVQLPLVADPVAIDVPVAFSADGTDGPESGLSVALALPGTMAGVRAMATDHVLLQLEAPGFAPSRIRTTIEEAASGTLRFQLTRGITITGHVVDRAAGTPLEGAVVAAVDQLPLDALDVAVQPGTMRLPRPYTVTDALGQFRLEHVAPSAEVRLWASFPGLAPSIESIATGQEVERITFELRPGSSVTGLVERPDGSPWDGAFVVVSKQDVDPSANIRPVMTFGAGSCDPAGEFAISGLPKGQYVALLFDPTKPRIPLEFRQVRLDGQSTVRTEFRAAVATDGFTLAGTLVDGTGAPQAGVTLTLAGLDGSRYPASDWRVSDTDANGAFRFPGIQPSTYAVYCASDGFGRMELVWSGVVQDSQPVEITMPSTGLTLRCSAAAGPGTSWAILERWRADRAEWFYAGRAASGTDGDLRSIQFAQLAPGRYRSTVIGPGHGATWSGPALVEAGRPTSVDVALAPGGALPLVAVGAESGQVIPGLIMTAHDGEGRMIPQRENILTATDGRCTQLAVPYGQTTLRLREPRGEGPKDPAASPRVDVSVEIAFDSTTSLPVQIEIPGR